MGVGFETKGRRDEPHGGSERVGKEAEGQLQMTSDRPRRPKSRSHRPTVLLALALILPAAGAESETRIVHFVAPSYPQLCVQAMIYGGVGLRLSIAKNGTVTNVEQEQTEHPLRLLSAAAAKDVREWRFNAASRERHANVLLIYGLSGRTREHDRETIVRADFEGSQIRVFITTDNMPMLLY